MKTQYEIGPNQTIGNRHLWYATYIPIQISNHIMQHKPVQETSIAGNAASTRT
jgi:hypothetical protein